MNLTASNLKMGLPINQDHLAQYNPVTDFDDTPKVWITGSQSFSMYGNKDMIIEIQRRCISKSRNFYDYLGEKGERYINLKRQQGTLHLVNDTKTNCKTRHIPILIIE